MTGVQQRHKTGQSDRRRGHETGTEERQIGDRGAAGHDRYSPEAPGSVSSPLWSGESSRVRLDRSPETGGGIVPVNRGAVVVYWGFRARVVTLAAGYITFTLQHGRCYTSQHSTLDYELVQGQHRKMVQTLQLNGSRYMGT